MNLSVSFSFNEDDKTKEKENTSSTLAASCSTSSALGTSAETASAATKGDSIATGDPDSIAEAKSLLSFLALRIKKKIDEGEKREKISRGTRSGLMNKVALKN